MSAPMDRAAIDERTREVQRVLVVTFFLNIAAALAMLAPAVVSGSLSLLAGGIDAVFDGGANIVGIFAARAAAVPPDRSHPYGHRKYETLVAVAIAVMLLLTCGRLAWSAVGRLMGEGDAPTIGTLALAAPLIAFVLSVAASIYERRKGRELKSELLLADAGHTGAHAGVALTLFAGLLAVRAGYPMADPILALVVAGVIAVTGVRIARSTLDVLADASALDPEEVAAVVRSVPGVVGAHKIRSRGPESAIAVDLHVQVDPGVSIDSGHAIGHDVQDRIRDEWPGVVDVVVHVEPEWSLVDNEIARSVRRVVARFPAEAHEICVNEADRTEVSLHLELDPTLSLTEAHDIASDIEAAVLADTTEVDRVVTHMEPREGTLPAAPIAHDRDYPSLVATATARIDGLSNAHSVEAVHVPGGVRLSAHVHAAGELPLIEAHWRAERLESEIKALAPELERVTIHVEPGEGSSSSV